MRRYETIYIIRPNIAEDEINAIVERTNGIIEQFNGQIVNLDHWGLKKLAYLIKKEKQGYYVYCEYAGTPEAVDEIERLFRIDEKVLKYMTIKTQDVYVADAPKPEPEVDVEEADATADAKPEVKADAEPKADAESESSSEETTQETATE